MNQTRSKRTVRITRFEVRAFRSCQATVLHPRPDLTALVGVNGSGKSNLLHALLLLSQLASTRLRSIRSTSQPFASDIRATFDVYGRPIDYRARLFLSAESDKREDIVHAAESWNFKSVTGSDRWIGNPMRYPPPYWRARLNRLDARHLGARFPRRPLTKRQDMYATAVQQFCSGIVYYSASRFTNPESCPSFFELDADSGLRSFEPQPTLEFLYDLYRCWVTQRSLYDQYISIVGSDGIGLIDRIAWRAIKAPSRDIRVRRGKVIREERNRTIVIPTILVRGVRLAPSQLSEGTSRSLALIFNLLGPKGSVILLEEPEVCVHHGLLSSIVEIMQNSATKRQIIFSTHSDFVLDALSPESVQVVRYSQKAGTSVRRLPEVMSSRDFESLKKYLRESGNLGEYWRHKGFA